MSVVTTPIWIVGTALGRSVGHNTDEWEHWFGSGNSPDESDEHSRACCGTGRILLVLFGGSLLSNLCYQFPLLQGSAIRIAELSRPRTI